jgi:Major Facilitator Superfamily
VTGPGRNSRSEILAPFAVRSFRFQWPADLLTSWGIEMEVLILGWYILTETGSVLLLTVYGSLQYLGTLIGPMLGLAGDRWGHRNVLCLMRLVYTVLAGMVMLLALTGLLWPIGALVIAGVNGLVRPSDLAMRNALVAETMPGDRLMAAMGVARTTSDSARVVGPLLGALLMSTLGLAAAYAVVTLFYGTGGGLTLKVGAPRGAGISLGRVSFWRDLWEGLGYVWDTPESLSAMWLAFLVNMTAYPLTLGLLPFVAQHIYHVGQTGLGTLTASFACGSLTGSIVIGMIGRSIRPARMMIIFACVWYAMLVGFIAMPGVWSGRMMLVAAGLAQSLSMTPMAVMLLQGAGPKFRGRVMGVRMMAIYGLPVGLLVAGWLVPRIGFTATASGYCLFGATMTVMIALRWRRALWPLSAPSNLRLGA